MKRAVTNILFALLFLVGFGILMYPAISNQWNNYRQKHLITGYESVISEMKEDDFSAQWELARAFNDTLEKNNIYGDAFGSNDGNLKETEYWKVLNIGNDGIMGYMTIPKINVRLAIYHGTEESVLQTGIGHVNGTKLPIGGESTHSVLAAHRGLPSAKLFTDIDQLKRGDMFYIHVLDETFAYQVDQVLDMVEKDDMKTMEAALSIEEGQDYVTLFTCTPYGVNSHRLLVRGTRVPYEGEEQVEAVIPETMVKAVQDYYTVYLLMVLAVTILIIIIIKSIMDRNFRRRKK